MKAEKPFSLWGNGCKPINGFKGIRWELLLKTLTFEKSFPCIDHYLVTQPKCKLK